MTYILEYFLSNWSHADDDKSTLVQVIAVKHQASTWAIFLSRSVSPYGVTRPQWVKYMVIQIMDGNYQFQPFSVISQLAEYQNCTNAS